MLFRDLVETSAALAATARRSQKVDLLAALLSHADDDELRIAVAFLTGAPLQGRLGIGPAALRDARVEAAATSPRATLRDVDGALARIAATTGPGAGGRRVRDLRALLARGDESERRFLVRLLLGELRQGALEGLMVEAVARATDQKRGLVRRALMVSGDLGAVALAARSEGEPGLARFAIRPMTALQPMLAQTAESVSEALEKLGQARFEHKLDGARVQVHKSGDDVRVFSRRLNDVTAAVPEVVELIRELPPRELILDGEAIALRDDGRPQPFQITMRRFGRKRDVEKLRDTLPLSSFYFDCLLVDRESLLDAPAEERWARLQSVVPEASRVRSLTTGEAVEAQGFLDAALSAGHEGVMAKSLGAPYEAGGRGGAWLKLKQVQTLDLVVLAAEWGHGRRKGRLSNLHLGARDTATGGFVMLGKTFKGLTDELLEWQTKELLARQVSADNWTVHVRPELVVEIAFNELQESPHYPGGLALRFARVKGYRPDKTPDQADTIETVRAIHARKNS